MHVHTAQVPVILKEIVSRFDSNDGQSQQFAPSCLQQGDLAIVRIEPKAPVVVEEFKKFGPMGRFALRDQNRTVAAGIITSISVQG
jgi:translation elongation factor EF-1alpha